MKSLNGQTSSIAIVAAMFLAAPVAAQESTDAATAETESSYGEIIITARKRDETSISVPVIVTAVGQAELERRAINSIDAIARVVPQLIVGEGGGSLQGGNIALRGVAGADTNPFADQAVSFNIDGVQVARSSVRRLATMDMAQVEVLKGPQALFFGKNSPGGIISIRSADPTQSFEAKLMAGYEFEGHEWRGEGYVSGPINDTLGFRVAVYGSRLRGWVKNILPKTELLAPPYDHVPKNKEYAVRGTLKFEPSEVFDARLKVSYNHSNATATSQNAQFISCPLPGGFPTGNPYDECKANNKVTAGIVGTSFTPFEPKFGDGVPYLHQRQALGSLEMNYHLSDHLTLTSVSGFYKTKLRMVENYFYSPYPILALPSFGRVDIRELSEEVRLTSEYDGPLNFMVGAHYQDSRASTGSITYLNALKPAFLNNYLLRQHGKAYSIFGQVLVDIVPTVELSVGMRYSKEKKSLPHIERALAASAPRTEVIPVVGKSDWNNLSPEVSLTWRPTQTLTLFGSYKEGFLSGGFNSGNTNFAANLEYDQQLIKGFEGGVKAALFNGALRTNLSIYRYVVTGLQVSNTPAPTIQIITNAGKMTTKGVEFDFDYRTPLEGLSLNGAIAYNKARYNIFTAACYRGQTFARGCNAGLPNALNLFVLQDLAGEQVVRAPDWSGNVGFNFERPIGGSLKIGISGDLTYSDSYFGNGLNVPATRQPSYTLLDATVRVGDVNDRWEVAFIGRNLTDKIYFTRGIEDSFTGSPGGNPLGQLADVVGLMNRGRELMIRLSYKFGQ